MTRVKAFQSLPEDVGNRAVKQSSYLAELKVLAPLTILAGAIRGLIAYNGPLWRDEALFIAIVRAGSFRDMLRFLHFHESHPPLFYALIRAWMSLAGDTDARVLMLPVALGIALVPLMFVVGSTLYSRGAGVVAAALTAVSPALSEFSGEIRPYSLLPMLVLISCSALVLGLERKSRWPWAAHVVSTVALVYTHNWSWLVVAGQVVATLFVLSRRTVAVKPGKSVEAGVAFLTIGAAYIPWIPTLLYQAAHAGHPPAGGPGLAAFSMLILGGVTTAVQSTLLPPVHAARVLVLVAGVALAALFLVVIFRVAAGRMPRIPEFRGEREASAEPGRSRAVLANTVFLIVAAAATGAAAVLSVHSDMLQPRCFVILTPLLLLVIADAFYRVWTDEPRALRRGLAIGIAVVLFIDYSVRLNFLISSPRSNSQSVAASVEQAARPSDVIIVVPEWIAPSLNHYYHSAVNQLDFPSFGRLDSIDFADLWNRFADPRPLERVRREIVAAREGKSRVWLIVDRQSLKPLSADKLARADKPGQYAIIASVRARQIEQMLIAEFGNATPVNPVSSKPPRYEELLVFLFSPR